jgi:hypothetical protein
MQQTRFTTPIAAPALTQGNFIQIGGGLLEQQNEIQKQLHEQQSLPQFI